MNQSTFPCEIDWVSAGRHLDGLRWSDKGCANIQRTVKSLNDSRLSFKHHHPPLVGSIPQLISAPLSLQLVVVGLIQSSQPACPVLVVPRGLCTYYS
jgi:hypothetical protein